MLDFLFNNIGGKLKLLGKIMCFLGFAGAIGTFIFTVVQAVQGEALWVALLGIPAAASVALAAWISSFPTIGFGQLVESTELINEKLDCIVNANKERD